SWWWERGRAARSSVYAPFEQAAYKRRRYPNVPASFSPAADQLLSRPKPLRVAEKFSMPRKIIIDTDPGQDDAVAILLALASPEEVEVLGIVAVAGNVGLAQNAKNALKVVELSGRTGVPVYAGCARPMMREMVTAEHVHRQSGLDGPDLP